MEKIKQIISYRLGSGMGERQVARALKVSRTVVSKYVQAFRKSGLTLERIEGMPDSELSQALHDTSAAVQPGGRLEQLRERFPLMLSELKKKGMTLQLLWERYREEHPDGYQYSRYCDHFQNWRDQPQLYMHIEHKAGEQMFVDWAGDKLEIIKASTDEPWALELFVAILPASELTFVEARESQAETDWIRANEAAMTYFGGVVEAIVPDNTKTAVVQSDPYEPGLNLVYEDFARHYGCVIYPARARRPRDKALVENAVRLVYQRVSVHLRGKRYEDLAEINEAIGELLEKHNTRNFSKLAYSRRELFEQIERQTLRPLPASPYALKDIQMATVQFNYHVELRQDHHYYSVPHYLRKREEPKTKVKLVYDDRVVAIYYDNQRVAQHHRDRTPNGYTTTAQHMPADHRFYAEWSKERFQSWARSMGTDVEAFVTRLIDSRPYAPQAFKSCMGVLSLKDSYGAQRLNDACRKALSLGSCSYKRVAAILAQGREQEKQPALQFASPGLPEHDNVRGADYFN